MYVVKKPLDIGGRRRKIGDVVGDNEVTSATLIRAGYLAEIIPDASLLPEDAAEPLRPFAGETNIDVPIISKGERMIFAATYKGVYDALWLMQTPVKDAVVKIGSIEDESTLIILDACDNRKDIRTAVRSRAEELKRFKNETAKNTGDEE